MQTEGSVNRAKAGHGPLVQYVCQKTVDRLPVPIGESVRQVEAGLDPLVQDLSQKKSNVDLWLAERVSRAEVSRGRLVLLVGQENVDLWSVLTGDSVNRAEVGPGL